MDATSLAAKLENFSTVLPSLLRGLADDDARWRPNAGAWSILEIVGHLLDSETDDFRVRLKLTLQDASAPWPAIDPEGAVVKRRHNERELEDLVTNWSSERRASVVWLKTLGEPDWSAAHSHPSLGTLRAGDLLAAWTAHDALHLHQIARRQFQLTERDAGEYTTLYAGRWPGTDPASRA